MSVFKATDDFLSHIVKDWNKGKKKEYVIWKNYESNREFTIKNVTEDENPYYSIEVKNPSGKKEVINTLTKEKNEVVKALTVIVDFVHEIESKKMSD